MLKVVTKITNSIDNSVARQVFYFREQETANEYVEKMAKIVNSRMDESHESYTKAIKWGLETEIRGVNDKTIIEYAPLWVMKELLLGG